MTKHYFGEKCCDFYIIFWLKMQLFTRPFSERVYAFKNLHLGKVCLFDVICSTLVYVLMEKFSKNVMYHLIKHPIYLHIKLKKMDIQERAYAIFKKYLLRKGDSKFRWIPHIEQTQACFILTLFLMGGGQICPPIR